MCAIKLKRFILGLFIIPFALLCIVDKQIHVICVVCISAIISYYFWHGNGRYFDFGMDFWVSTFFLALSAICIIAGGIEREKFESTEFIQGEIAQLLVKSGVSECVEVSNGLESIYNSTCPPGTIYLVKQNNAIMAIARKYKMDFQLVNDTDNPNRFWLRAKDKTDLYCVVKQKKGYDIVIVIEKRKEDALNHL